MFADDSPAELPPAEGQGRAHWLAEDHPEDRYYFFEISYEGTNYNGWQYQHDLPTVQGELNKAIETLTKTKTTVHGAGRTDAGVHAIGQTGSFRTRSTIPLERWPKALQSQLPHDISIRNFAQVPKGFHASYDAVKKRYRYLLADRRLKAAYPMLRRFVHRTGYELDVAPMQQAASAVIGTHDFRSFESQWPNKATSERTVFDCTVSEIPVWSVWQQQKLCVNSAGVLPEDRIIAIDIVADGFLYNMVRTIAGSLMKIGQREYSAEWMTEIRDAMDRKQAGPTAPACGLFLVEVSYPQEIHFEYAEVQTAKKSSDAGEQV